MTDQPPVLTDKRADASHLGLKIFGYVVLALMAVTIVFTFYIMAMNWSHIGV